MNSVVGTGKCIFLPFEKHTKNVFKKYKQEEEQKLNTQPDFPRD